MDRTAWERDYWKVMDALEPHTRDHGDWWEILPTAPKELTDLHHDLELIGYANGWM